MSMSLTNVRLIFLRELRDQLRDRRTLFTVLILPLLLYPLLGMSVFQVQQFLKEHPAKVRIVGTDYLPQSPALLSDGRLAPEFLRIDPSLFDLESVPRAAKSLDELIADSRRDIRLGSCDVVVVFPDDFADRVAAFRGRGSEPREDEAPAGPGEKLSATEPPRPHIIFDSANDKSKVANQRVESVINHWRDALGKRNLEEKKVSLAAFRPFELVPVEVSEEVRRRAAIWSKILPFVLMVWALTGAFYPAVDLCAGEKERGTLETLLSSPAARFEIVWGKLLTVMFFSMATALLNLVSMMGTGSFVLGQLRSMSAAPMPLEIGPPPLVALLWLVLALAPISALFSALALAIAAFARSSKEGQYYLMPLMLISLPLMLLPMWPAMEIDLGVALIPLSGLMLLLRALIEGQYLEALRFSVPVMGVTAICCLLAIRWAVDQFNNESVLFRESERFGLGLWLRHLVRDRQETPTAGEALLCGVLLLIIRFFAGLMMRPPDNWGAFFAANLTVQIAFIAAPACLMAIMLTRRPLLTLSLGRPSFAATLPAAMLLALLLHPLMTTFSHAIQILYPLNPSVQKQLEPMMRYIAEQPLWQVLLLIAAAPALCEELAFRGFILSGLRRLGHRWAAIALSSVFFGLTHFMLQQSLAAAIVGVVIGYIAVKTGSLWPAVLYHFTHNSLSVLLGRLIPADIESHPLLGLVYRSGSEAGSLVYSLPALLAGTALAAAVLWWLKRLPYRQSAEERLQEALDHQPTAAALQSAA
jgi:sodium transport system permease protein